MLNPLPRTCGSGARLACVPLALAALMSGCAVYEPLPVASSPTASSPAATAPQQSAYRAVRASELLGRTARNQHGDLLGRIEDVIVQMDSGQVRYAVVRARDGGPLHALPVHGLATGPGEQVRIDLASRNLADFAAWSAWPGMQDVGYWSEVDRRAGFTPVQPGHGYDRYTDLRGKLVVDNRNVHLGRVEDLVIDAGADRIHYAVVGLEQGVPGGARLVAVPVHGFALPRAGTNRLALTLDAGRLSQFETFDAARWAQLNDPTYVARVERHFVAAFPAAAAALFDQLDTNRDGFLSRAELAPLQRAGTERYLLPGSLRATPTFRALDRDGDGFLTQAEAGPLLASGGAAFQRLDANADGFLSMAEAAPLVAGAGAPGTEGLTFAELDRDRDGFVNRAEAAALLPVPAVVTQQVVVQPVVTFEALDVDRDGYLNRAEAATVLQRTGDVTAFDRFDTNRDGFLSRAELDVLLQHTAVGATGGAAASGALRP